MISQSPITNYQLPITNYQLPITNYQLPITNYQLPAPTREIVISVMTKVQWFKVHFGSRIAMLSFVSQYQGYKTKSISIQNL
ncbi:hypothetical protein [Sphaerospermopsis sp. LEGE 08334]|uniref:hypothetical protein n=1 Tax=Sphaerospermopsis sp. LEGE 08334 TaxID=1828651 RepID=UPI001881E5A3|nr:hypothetical protein [Sphaerospermopsis sp. LEGE 08334]